MKKLILFLILFLGLVPVIKKQGVALTGISSVYADFGDEDGDDWDDDDWWDDDWDDDTSSDWDTLSDYYGVEITGIYTDEEGNTVFTTEDGYLDPDNWGGTSDSDSNDNNNDDDCSWCNTNGGDDGSYNDDDDGGYEDEDPYDDTSNTNDNQQNPPNPNEVTEVKVGDKLTWQQLMDLLDKFNFTNREQMGILYNAELDDKQYQWVYDGEKWQLSMGPAFGEDGNPINEPGIPENGWYIDTENQVVYYDGMTWQEWTDWQDWVNSTNQDLIPDFGAVLDGFEVPQGYNDWDDYWEDYYDNYSNNPQNPPGCPILKVKTSSTVSTTSVLAGTDDPDWCNKVKDCAGNVGGTAYYDEFCNCVGGKTGLSPGNQPKKGDPIRYPEIAATGAGLKGGRNGYTRKFSDGTLKYHDGTDIKATPGTPLFPIYSGIVFDLIGSVPSGTYGNSGAYGNYIIIKSTLANGEIIYLKYNHLDGVDVVRNQQVSTFDVIGTTGSTGNASKKNVINKHVHIQCRPSNDFGLGSYKHYTPDQINPENHIKTKFDQNGNKIDQPCNN
ncbi:MAG TPA: M23 family metallopeptidase [Pelobium sp.]|nr:M23 family metallopeptidase [Pelobium sp.]